MRRVVVDGADDYAPRPRSGRPKRSALELPSFIAGLHVFHLTSMSGRDPFRVMFQLHEVADWGDSGQLKPCLASCLLYEICDFGDLIQLVCPAQAGTPRTYIVSGRARTPILLQGRKNKGSEKIPQVMRELDRECRFE